MAMSALIKSLEDIMRKDAGLNGDAQYIEQITWLLFLKAFDAKEMEWEFRPEYRGSTIPEGFRWRDWADDKEGITGDALIKFVDELFDKLKKLDVSDGDLKKFVVRNVFADINNYMKSGIYLRQLINRINEKVDFIDATQKGRCGVVLPDGFMFGDGVKVAIKKRMLDEYGLHTIIRLPQVFKPYASVNTNLLFFQKGVPSRGVWFYRLDYPEGVKSFTKTKPMLDKHFDPVREWWADKQPMVVDGKDKARFFTVDELVAMNYDFDKCCPFPHEEEEILEPAELIARYQAERAELNANIDRILADISAMLEVKES